MENLFAQGQLKLIEYGRPSEPRKRIEIVQTQTEGEDDD